MPASTVGASTWQCVRRGAFLGVFRSAAQHSSPVSLPPAGASVTYPRKLAIRQSQNGRSASEDELTWNRSWINKDFHQQVVPQHVVRVQAVQFLKLCLPTED